MLQSASTGRPHHPQTILSMRKTILAMLAVGTLAAGPALPSDNGTVQIDVNERVPAGADGESGCNPYIVINPPDLPPNASNMNGITITTNIGGVCGNWRARPQVVPALSLPKV